MSLSLNSRIVDEFLREWDLLLLLQLWFLLLWFASQCASPRYNWLSC